MTKQPIISPATRASNANVAAHTKFHDSASMRTNWYDAITSFLLACVLMLGCLVGVLFVVWVLSGRDEDVAKVSPPIPALSSSVGIDAETPFDTPAESETTHLADLPIDQTVRSVSLIANQVATIDALEGLSDYRTIGGRPGHAGDLLLGDSEGDDIVPRFERWQIHFHVASGDEYARMLDFHEIELAAIGGDVQGVDCVSQLSTQPVVRKITDTATEKRLYFMWTSASPLAEYDRQLIQAAGVSIQGRHTLKFISQELENQLAVLELETAHQKGYESVQQIAKTVFECRRVGDGFDFKLISQRYR
ncbi:hypothetical protein [Neorhodopirellula pilleata]|uniref:Uncharacterized protein n=1 Tax=Neorhodopirellula pilleata TaxID=2714738 RepID=A0A5C6AQN3_9BACT|nr:hypothetical protein [Neorhodopirellula pilleata]TWU01797.1 hypothetical protein Pla100_15330 [Neorhodopirellula pilleata]